jgi:hypothetical protein
MLTDGEFSNPKTPKSMHQFLGLGRKRRFSCSQNKGRSGLAEKSRRMEKDSYYDLSKRKAQGVSMPCALEIAPWPGAKRKKPVSFPTGLIVSRK